MWAIWMQRFTPSQLADVMGVSPESIGGYVLGLLYNDTIRDSGTRSNGAHAVEVVYEFNPLPEGPRFHPRALPPEIVVALRAGGDPLRVRRGEIVPGTSSHGSRRVRRRVQSMTGLRLGWWRK